MQFSVKFLSGFEESIILFATCLLGFYVVFVDHIDPIELEIKDTTDTIRSVSYLDLHLKIDIEGRLRTKLYNKRDYFNFLFVTTIQQHLHMEFISFSQ